MKIIISDSDNQSGDMINMRGDFGNRIVFQGYDLEVETRVVLSSHHLEIWTKSAPD